MKKTGVDFKEKTTVTQGIITVSETTTSPAEDITGRSYIQFGAGIGFYLRFIKDLMYFSKALI